eukprot:SAG11_NODE_947_length_6417_cov_1.986705_5_plen_56_part_00
MMKHGLTEEAIKDKQAKNEWMCAFITVQPPSISPCHSVSNTRRISPASAFQPAGV